MIVFVHSSQTTFFTSKGERMGLNRREFVQGAVAGVALTAATAPALAAFGGDDADKRAVLQQIPKMHAENVKRLQEVDRSSIHRRGEQEFSAGAGAYGEAGARCGLH